MTGRLPGAARPPRRLEGANAPDPSGSGGVRLSAGSAGDVARLATEDAGRRRDVEAVGAARRTVGVGAAALAVELDALERLPAVALLVLQADRAQRDVLALGRAEDLEP